MGNMGSGTGMMFPFSSRAGSSPMQSSSSANSGSMGTSSGLISSAGGGGGGSPTSSSAGPAGTASGSARTGFPLLSFGTGGASLPSLSIGGSGPSGRGGGGITNAMAATAATISEGSAGGAMSCGATALSTGPVEAVAIPSEAYPEEAKTKITILPRHIPATHLFFCILFSRLTLMAFFNSKDC